ncbi:glycerol dehydratase [Kaustia mangrovi]|uniref:Glycerol dehydratase n=1 Tax=Kaustia mangrovi TaxID=2593653 RepID=A0A7S8HBS0_9HYPH|nr:diol dehydratase small subunit [Kaustia mangrovi]QPC42493.1 glycerol dehydratase [Kaustia mangrovi]
MTERLTAQDYPIAEKRPELARGRQGKGLDEITLDALGRGAVALEDLTITADALRRQAEIARSANRPTLAENFERAAELVDVPQDVVMAVYELLRPGRAKSAQDLVEAAAMLRETYGADRMAAFVEEAADVYERRGLFAFRF